MAKAIFTVKTGSGYKDLVEAHYHFPRTYLNQVEAAEGDAIVYYEPRRAENGVGRQAYFATARVVGIDRDPEQSDHFYARVSDYIDFDKPVGFNESGIYYEGGLQKEDGSTNKGAFGRAVRPISEIEFDLILRAGFSNELAVHDAAVDAYGLAEPVVEFQRPMVEMTVSRPFREKGVYDCRETCLRQPMCGYRADADQRRRAPGSSSRPYSAGCRKWTGWDPEWHSPLRHVSLAF